MNFTDHYKQCNLTPGEIKVVELMLKDYTILATSIALNISKRTIEGYRRRIYKKTHTSTPLGLYLKFNDQTNHV